MHVKIKNNNNKNDEEEGGVGGRGNGGRRVGRGVKRTRSKEVNTFAQDATTMLGQN